MKIICIIFLSVISSFAQIETGSFPWTVKMTNPKAVAAEVVETFLKEDYFTLYALVDEEIMVETKSAVARMDTSKFGVDINFSFMTMSDFGRRFGVQAVFDQIMTHSRGKYFTWANRVDAEDVYFKDIVNIDEQHTMVQYSFDSEHSPLSIYLKKNESKWYLEKVEFRDEEWPPYSN